MYMIDLFAGCGGATTGFEQSGFESILVSEINTHALGTYLINRTNILGEIEFRKQSDLHIRDIRELTEERLKQIQIIIQSRVGKNIIKENGNDSELDLIVGGPPCQGYSTIGYRRTYNVERKFISQNQLYKDMVGFIEKVRSKIFLFENVRGLLTAKWTLSGKKGEIWEDVLRSFQEIEGYQVRWSLIQCRNYGVPQNRPRIILVGIRNDCLNSKYIDLKSSSHCALKCGFIPEINESAPNLEDLLSDLEDESILESLEKQDYPEYFSSVVYKKKPRTIYQEELRKQKNGTIIMIGEPLREQEYSKHSKRVYEKFKHMHENEGKIADEMKTKKFSQRLLPRKWGNEGPTITATSLADDYVHYSQPRTLTVRELSRIQTFPDWYQFLGPRTTGSVKRAGNPSEPEIERVLPKYTQVGNAVPVKLAKLLGDHFQKILYG